MSTEVIIAGFHRSGTSMVAQLLHQAGLYLGDDLLGAMPSNPYGHFEDREIVRLHDAILRDNGMNWQVASPLIPRIALPRWTAAERFVRKRRMEHRRWGFKDPRVCLFLGAWKHLMPGARILIVYRSAIDAAHSLEHRHATQLLSNQGPEQVHRRFWQEPDLALRMWLVHNEALLRVADRYRNEVVAISFDAIARGFPLVDRLNEVWDLGLTPVPTHSVFDPTVTQSRAYPMTVTATDLIPRSLQVWRRLRALERTTALSEEESDAA